MPVKKIPTSDVQIGMFISSLDRPWSETPFLFQGFAVREQDEIARLIEYTKHVYIMVADEEIELHGLPSSHVSTLPSSERLSGDRYRITLDTQHAIEAAKESHDRISLLITDIETIVEQGSCLDPGELEEPIAIMVESVVSNPDAYIWLTRIRNFDSYLYKDAMSASVWATALGRELGLAKNSLRLLATGTLLMDVGKMALPAALLNKTTHLRSDEWDIIKRHVQHGLDTLAAYAEVAPAVLEIVQTHHERIDGSGYPHGLRGNQIPLMGQIAGVVDFYTSVTMPRPYAPAVSPTMALRMLYQQKGRYFDADLVENMIQVASTYPTGSLVELSSGEIALVTSQNPGLRLKPNLVLLLDPHKRPYDAYPIVSLANYDQGPNQEPVHIVKTLADGQYGLKIEELQL